LGRPKKGRGSAREKKKGEEVGGGKAGPTARKKDIKAKIKQKPGIRKFKKQRAKKGVV